MRILILEERTRNLSSLSNTVIRNCLSKCNEVIISISHDRKYIKEVANKIYGLTYLKLKEIKKEEIV